jgi:tRNA (guanine37-N1)-methyltransferase
MKFDIITIFPALFEPFLKESLIEKAVSKKHIEVNVHDLRKWTEDVHKTVDEKPFGGGSGMVMKVEPIYRAVSEIKKENSKVILFTPRGKKFNQKKATDFSYYNQLIMICGRYEGVDERVAKHIADEEISLGDYVLMGGELPAMIVTEVVSRLVPGVVGKDNFLKERKKSDGFLEYPQYTRPESFLIDGKKRNVPKVLLSGNHKKIEEWKNKKGKIIK